MAEYANQRNKDESFVDYKARMKAQTKAEKFKLNNGNILWDSGRQGTYLKAKHGAL